MIPEHTETLLEKIIRAKLNDSSEVLRISTMTCAENNMQRGIHGDMANSKHVLTLYDEYKRRAEIIEQSISEVLSESSFKYYRDLGTDLEYFFHKQIQLRTSDISAELTKIPSTKKPSFDKFKATLHEKLIAKVHITSEKYLTHHHEVVRSFWAVYGTKFIKWLIVAIGTIIIAVIIKLIEKEIEGGV